MLLSPLGFYLFYVPALCCRKCSASKIELAQATFRLSTFPLPGMDTLISQSSASSWLRPCDSEPKANTHFFGNLQENTLCDTWLLVAIN